jgi:glycosyltransferase involved in cell wall biosynthesis
MPKSTFSIVGLDERMLEYVKSWAPPNVKLYGYVQHHDLPRLLSEHKVYTQLSLSEGLPNALCEGMLCECIPVGSAVGGIPKGIGKAGFVLHKKDVNEAVRLIRLALDSDENLGELARQHIIDNFSYDLRKDRILSILNSDYDANLVQV